MVAVLAVPIGIASLRVRGASFVIVSIALVLILLLVFQSWGAFTGGSNGLRVPRPFARVGAAARAARAVLLPPRRAARGGAAGLVGDRPLPLRHRASRRSARTRTRPSRSACRPSPTSSVAFVVSAFFTALGGGLYALWFGFLDPIFQFSILVGSYMVLMSLLGGIRSLFGPLARRGDRRATPWSTSRTSTATPSSTSSPWACCSASSCCSCPTGSSRRLGQLVDRFRPQAPPSARSAPAELAEQRRTASGPGASADGRPGRRRRVDRPPLRRSAAMTTTDTRERDRHPHRARHRGADQVVRRRDRRRRRERAVPPRQGQRPDRAQRLGQDDVLQLRHRDDQARLGRATLPRATTSPARRRTASPAPASAAASSCAGSSRG